MSAQGLSFKDVGTV